MTKFKKNISICLLILSIISVVSYGQNSLPKKPKTLRAIELANKYFMNMWPDAGKEIFVPSKNRTWPSHIWTRAVYYEGLMALYNIDKQKTYYDYIVDWGTKHNWSMRDSIKTRNADNQCCGQTYIDMYLLTKNEAYIKNIKASVDLMMHTDKIDDWNWVDAIQMAMPVFARLGSVYNDTNYFHRMYEMYEFSKYKQAGNGLYNQTDHLWWRDKDFVSPYKEPNGSNCYWSRGNGWVIAALVRTLEWLPKTDPHYNEYLQNYKDMCKSLLPLQRSDGFWNVSLLDSSHFGGKELTGTSLFAYGFAWGINHNILDKKVFMPAVIKSWNALIKDCMHTDGKLGYVQGTGKEPKDSQPVSFDNTPDFEDFGLGCFLLAGTEIYKLK